MQSLIPQGWSGLAVFHSHYRKRRGILLPSESLLTTQEAATLLNVSRPHLVKLLESGVIPFQKVGTHRRVFLEDVNAYEIQLKQKRKSNLQFLADQAQ
ncbi:helix-turn-helix domain-containing protein, partial [Nostoc sp. CHAB 5715]|uniref:helix-turn-helix domain-containing protein n=1 Tax=Nostoc sp. CHAB 5715 TaxID=2780400 RepID=UPI001E3C6870